jgi:hypothetical protein
MRTKRPFEVIETKDYSIFKHIDYNRSVNRSNVKKIMKSIIEYGLIVPIVVSEEGYIIDGQHRLEALIALDMTVWYVVSKNIKEDTVMEVNGCRKNWTSKDWVDSFAEKRNEEYQSLLLQYEIWGGTFPQNAINDAFYKRLHTTSSIIRKGVYQCDVEFGSELLNNCIKASEVMNERAYTTKFIRALKIIMMRNPDNFNIDRLIEKAKVKKIYIYNNEHDIASDIVEAYNHKLSNKENKIKS